MRGCVGPFSLSPVTILSYVNGPCPRADRQGHFDIEGLFLIDGLCMSPASDRMCWFRKHHGQHCSLWPRPPSGGSRPDPRGLKRSIFFFLSVYYYCKIAYYTLHPPEFPMGDLNGHYPRERGGWGEPTPLGVYHPVFGPPHIKFFLFIFFAVILLAIHAYRMFKWVFLGCIFYLKRSRSSSDAHTRNNGKKGKDKDIKCKQVDVWAHPSR